MTQTREDLVPPGAEIFTGPRGSKYYFRNGHKVYITSKHRKKRRNYNKPTRGAFARYLDNCI